jgi:anti-anti-sigma factor
VSCASRERFAAFEPCGVGTVRERSGKQTIMTTRGDDPPINIQVDHNEDRAVVYVAGEVDMYNSRKLRETLFDLIRKRKVRKLIISLKDVPSMDSSGIATLMEGLSEIKKKDGEIILVGIHESLRGVLSLTGLLGVLDIRPGVEDAVD